MAVQSSETPALRVSRIEAKLTRQLTPCGAGTMVWREIGAGAALVLLHGASGSWTHWILNILPLAERFRVLAPDLPGFGDSTTPPEPHTAEALADLVCAGLDRIVPPPGRFDLAGFSFGGIVAGLVAARLGERARTLVLVGPGGMGLRHAALLPLLRETPGMTCAELRRVHCSNLRALMIANPGQVDDLAVFVHAENLLRSRFRSGSIPVSDVLLRALPDVRARITAIWGSHDAFVGPYLEERRRLLASYQPDLDFRVIEGAGHWVIYEAAGQVNAAIADMLKCRD